MRKFFKMLSGGTKAPDVIEFASKYLNELNNDVAFYTGEKNTSMSVNICICKREFQGKWYDYVTIWANLPGWCERVEVKEENFITSETDFQNLKDLVVAQVKLKFRAQ